MRHDVAGGADYVPHYFWGQVQGYLSNYARENGWEGEAPAEPWSETDRNVAARRESRPPQRSV